MKFPKRIAVAGERAVKTYDGKSLIFYPDPPHKMSLARLRRCYVKYQCANFTQKLTPHVSKVISAHIQTIGIGINHLQKALRQIVDTDTEKSVEIGDRLMHQSVFSSLDWFKVKTLGKIRMPDEIAVAIGLPAFQLAFFIAYSLDVGLDQRRILANGIDFLMLPLDNFGLDLS